MKLGQKIVYAVFIALLISTLVVSHPIRVHAAEVVASESFAQTITSAD